MPDKNWNSLEVAKLLVGVATPVSLFLLGAHYADVTNQTSRIFQEQQMRYSRRSAHWDKIKPLLNRVIADLDQAYSQSPPLNRKEVVKLVRHAEDLRLEWEMMSMEFSPNTTACANDLGAAIRLSIGRMVSEKPITAESAFIYSNFYVNEHHNRLINWMKLDIGMISENEAKALKRCDLMSNKSVEKAVGEMMVDLSAYLKPI